VDRSEIAKRFAWDRHYSTRTVLRGLEDAGACFIVHEHANHSHLAEQGEWQDSGRTETGAVREQEVAVADAQTPWRRMELALDQPTEDGDTTLWPWSNLPEAVTAGWIAELNRTCWRVKRSRSPGIDDMFARLESMLDSELRRLGHLRAALLGFAAATDAEVQVLWWNGERWAAPGPFGIATMPLEAALDYSASEPHFWTYAWPEMAKVKFRSLSLENNLWQHFEARLGEQVTLEQRDAERSQRRKFGHSLHPFRHHPNRQGLADADNTVDDGVAASVRIEAA